MIFNKTCRFALFATAALLYSAAVAIAQAPAKAPIVFSEKDRAFALKYMNETKEDFVKQLTGLSDAQLNYREAEGRWTIAEIAEHIIVVENALFGMVTNQVMKSAAPKCEDPFRVGDMTVILSATNRSTKFTAPEMVRPNGRWKTRDELLLNFDKTRNTTMDFMKNNTVDLRSMFGQGPPGTIDAFQWLLFMTAHSERHLAQLKEVKASAKYPAK